MKGIVIGLSVLITSLISSVSSDEIFEVFSLDQGGDTSKNDLIGFIYATLNSETKGVDLAFDISPNTYLTPGAHGFHLHENPSCSNSDTTVGGEAGGHWDPDATGVHLGPDGDGHRGDLPTLYVKTDGSSDDFLRVPRLRLNNLIGKSFVIHANGDNFSDIPKPLGGGGARVACATRIIEVLENSVSDSDLHVHSDF
eukprot:GHVN01033660.1.p1 GENE.GHVN01033660.1~~GHVN01033660.1.p1  ORF type:complete len:197 (+),score=49.56 GHVN01033660.1:124-714(+)